ncbi:hypothetical protein DdX_06807 [Ditylenchus destructor]|uniref:Uncharacterized protein n=1 Tax=Ditylenchus destructor TaxID=166010 RepID=A0AAD4N942_9BILA|nr:hypothetical protein DdX_06807 [Ditylenchus destructor]
MSDLGIPECDPAEFVLFYIKNRIEWDGKYIWHDAPHVRDRLTPKCQILKEAALLFEREKVEKLRKLLVPLFEGKRLNFQNFKFILDTCFEKLHERAQRDTKTATNSIASSPMTIPLLVIISFSGFYARRLAELDEEYASRGEWRRDFRREINQISIYASSTIQGKLSTAEDRFAYSWDAFLDDTSRWFNDTKQLLERSRSPTQVSTNLVQQYLGVIMRNSPVIATAATAVFLTGAALFLRRRFLSVS